MDWKIYNFLAKRNKLFLKVLSESNMFALDCVVPSAPWSWFLLFSIPPQGKNRVLWFGEKTADPPMVADEQISLVFDSAYLPFWDLLIWVSLLYKPKLTRNLDKYS